MNRVSKQLLLMPILGLIAVLPAVAQDWAGGGRVKGTVYNEAGDTLPGAEVRLLWGENEENGPEPLITDKKGRWSYIGLKPGFWFFEIHLEGYRPFKEQIEVFQTTIGEPAKSTLRVVSQEVKESRRREGVNKRLQEGIELSEAGQTAEARAIFEKALTQMKAEEQPMVLTGIADTYFQEGNHPAGREQLEKALAIDSEFGPALKMMVWALAEEGLDEEAQQYIDRLPADVEVDPSVEINLGIMRYNEGDMDGAGEIFERVAADHPDIAEAQYFSGLVHLNQDKNAEALAEFKRMLELEPDHEKAGEVQGFIEYLESVQ